MGNTPSSVVLRRDPEDDSHHLRLGKSVSIHVPEVSKFGTHRMSYHVDDRTSTLQLQFTTKETGHKKEPSEFAIFIEDKNEKWSYTFLLTVQRKENRYLTVKYAKTSLSKETRFFPISTNVSTTYGSYGPHRFINVMEEGDPTMNTIKTNMVGGRVIETSLNPYKFSDKEKGLVVIQWKRWGWDQSPYMVTVAHYFASLGTNTGLSMEMEIRGEADDDLVFEGLVLHPPAALFQMFHQVLKSGCWTPTACPHCANPNQMCSSLVHISGDIKGDGNGCVYLIPDSKNKENEKDILTQQKKGHRYIQFKVI